MASGDGDGWVECRLGHRHWGRHGAAGLLLYGTDPVDAGRPRARVLLQHRAPWSHHGDTWGIPGGASDSHEDAATAALREAQEEAALDVGAVAVHATVVDDHGDWSYTTVLAGASHALTTTPNRESLELRWVEVDQVATLPLHPGFAATWPQVAARPVTVVVDAANVVGSRPDGWWRDRAGAATRLVAALARQPAPILPGPRGGWVVVLQWLVVLEGQARTGATAGRHGRAEVLHATAAGDDLVVAASHGALVQGAVVVVTADRGLRDRLPNGTGSAAEAGSRAGTGTGAGAGSGAGAESRGALTTVGPRWLHPLLD